MRLFQLSIAYLTLLFAAVAVTALLPWADGALAPTAATAAAVLTAGSGSVGARYRLRGVG